MDMIPWGFKGSPYNEVIHCSAKFSSYFQWAIDWLPDDIFSFVMSDVSIICLTAEDACRVARELCKNREIILISERLLPKNREQPDSEKAIYLYFAIYHEIAHAFLKHESPRYSSLTAEQNELQEVEADLLALRWYNLYVEEFNNEYIKPIDVEFINRIKNTSMEILKEINA